MLRVVYEDANSYFPNMMTERPRTQWLALTDGSCGSDEEFVRRALRALERDFRRLALTLLIDWEQTGLTARELFPSLASLTRPSWGTWNGLLDGLRAAVRSVARNGDADALDRLAGASQVQQFIRLWDQPISTRASQACDVLGDLLGQTVRRARFSTALTLPISLRNAIEHGRAPEPSSQPPWWRSAAESIRQLVAEHVEGQLGDSIRHDKAVPPWSIDVDGECWYLNGFRDSTPYYVGPDGDTRAEPLMASAVMLSFRGLLGQQDAEETEIRKLLAQLAPEEIRGVLLDDYLVGNPIGHGGFAAVHAGRQLSTGGKVAIKVLHDGMGCGTNAGGCLSRPTRARSRSTAVIIRLNGDVIQSRRAYEQSLVIGNRLLELAPDHTGWQRDVSVTYFALGDSWKDEGDLARAKKAYQAGMAIRQKLAAADPANTRAQRDFALGLNSMKRRYRCDVA